MTGITRHLNATAIGHSSTPPLQNAQYEKDLARSAAAGDRDATDLLVRANLDLIVVIARRYLGRGHDLEDLIAEGVVGLLRAIPQFDLNYGTCFRIYAAYWIRQTIQAALINTAGLVRVPTNMARRLRQWRHAERELEAERGQVPSFEEVANRLGLRQGQRGRVRQAMHAWRLRAGDAPLGQECSHVELLHDHRENPGEGLERSDEMRSMEARLARRIDARAYAVLELRFGLGESEPLTLREVGALLGLSHESVRNIELDALAKLRDMGSGSERICPQNIITANGQGCRQKRTMHKGNKLPSSKC